MLHAKYLFEEELKKSGLNYVIHRPTGYFYDIAKVFMPMIEKGEVTLLGKKAVSANVIDTPDFAEFIVAHMTDEKKMYNIGGKETILKFSKWTLTNDLVGDTIVGGASFKEYIESRYNEGK